MMICAAGLSVPQQVQYYSFAVTVHRSLRHRAPCSVSDYCVLVSVVSGRHHLRSARRHQLSVPRVHRSTFGTRAFSVAGPTVWNSLPDDLRDPNFQSRVYIVIMHPGRVWLKIQNSVQCVLCLF